MKPAESRGNIRRSVLRLLAVLALFLPMAGSAIWIEWSAPSSVSNGQSYTVEAWAHDSYYGSWVDLWKNSDYFAGGGDYASGSSTDSGPQTIWYSASAYDYYSGETVTSDFGVTVAGASNQPPNPWVEVDGHTTGAAITRPAGGSVPVTVRYKATDPDGNLTGLRPQVWHPDSGYFTNDGATSRSIATVTGTSGPTPRMPRASSVTRGPGGADSN
jgi:hypothetical protein